MPSVPHRLRAARTPYTKPASVVTNKPISSAQHHNNAFPTSKPEAKPSFLQSFLDAVLKRKSTTGGTKPVAAAAPSEVLDASEQNGNNLQATQTINSAEVLTGGHSAPLKSNKVPIGIAAGSLLVDAALAELREVLQDREGVLDAKSIIKMYSEKVLGMDRSVFKAGLDSDQSSESEDESSAPIGSMRTDEKRTGRCSFSDSRRPIKRSKTTLPGLTESALKALENQTINPDSSSAKLLSGVDVPSIPTTRARPVLTLKPLTDTPQILSRKDQPGVIIADFDLSDDEPETDTSKSTTLTLPGKAITQARRPAEFPQAKSLFSSRSYSSSNEEPQKSGFNISAMNTGVQSKLFDQFVTGVGEQQKPGLISSQSFGDHKAKSTASSENKTDKQPPKDASGQQLFSQAAPKTTALSGSSNIGLSPVVTPTSGSGLFASKKPEQSSTLAQPASLPAKSLERSSIPTESTKQGFSMTESQPAHQPSFSFGSLNTLKGSNPLSESIVKKAELGSNTNTTSFSFGQTKPPSNADKESVPLGVSFGTPASSDPSGSSTTGRDTELKSNSLGAEKQGFNDAYSKSQNTTGSGLFGGTSSSIVTPSTTKPIIGFNTQPNATTTATTPVSAMGQVPQGSTSGAASSGPSGPSETDVGSHNSTSLFGLAPNAPAAGSASFNSKPSQTGFVFGGQANKPADQAAAPASIFGSSAAPQAVPGPSQVSLSKPSASGGFDVKAPSAAPATLQAPSSTSLFGAPKPVAPIPAPQSGSAFTFGATTAPIGGVATSSNFAKPGSQAPSLFGSSAVPSTPTAPAPFGTSSAPTSTNFAFGAQSQTGTQAKPSGFNFGASSASSAPTNEKPAQIGAFTFGASPSNPPGPQAPAFGGSTGFKFGASASAPQFAASTSAAAQPPVFGASAAAQSQPNPFAAGLDNSGSAVAGRKLARPTRRLQRR